MKRFSAPPSLYFHQSQPSPASYIPVDHDIPAPEEDSAAGVLLRHDPSHKRVKTDQTFESLLDATTRSDIVINVNDDQFVYHAHRTILEMKSDVLAGLLAALAEKSDAGPGVASLPERQAVPVLHLREDPECGAVFSRFLYFLYSGAVWLHHEYVLPLFRLAQKYKVNSLRAHCQAYILQVLAKTCSVPPSSSSPSARSGTHHLHQHLHHHNHAPMALQPASNAHAQPVVGAGFPLDVVCDLYEDEVFVGEIQQSAFRVLCCQFRHLVRTHRWAKLHVRTVCELTSADLCNVEENLILASATDYMKRNNLSDKKQIEEILSNIRYPCLNKRVLYHLQKNGSFDNFPYIQELMLNALKFHSFKDLPEAKDDFTGVQFCPRLGRHAFQQRRASIQVAAPTDIYPEPTVFAESMHGWEAPIPTIVNGPRQSQV